MSKYADLIRETHEQIKQEEKRPRLSASARERRDVAAGLGFAALFILGMAATSLGALTNLPVVIAVGGGALALWLILLVVWAVVGRVRRKRS